MQRLMAALLTGFLSTPVLAVDAWTCFEDADNIQLTGQVIREVYTDQEPWVLLTEEGYCGKEYSLELADYKITATNVMRFQLIRQNEQPAIGSSIQSKTVHITGQVFRAFEPDHRTPMVILVDTLDSE